MVGTIHSRMLAMAPAFTCRPGSGITRLVPKRRFQMRLVSFACVVSAAFIGLAVAGSVDTGSLRAGEQTDPVKVNSLWQGTCEQSNPNSSYPMILFVKQRKGN